MVKKYLFIILLFALARCAPDDEELQQYVIPTYANVNYAGDTTVAHRLDIFIPEGLTQPAPLVLHIHGGGFITGEKGQAIHQLGGIYYQPYTYCDSLYAHGYILADMNYRLAGDSVFPALIYDCKTAVRFLKAHAATYKIDTCKVGVMGESAGGLLAAFLGASMGVDSLEGRHLGSNNASSNVQAVMDIYGVTDFNYYDGYFTKTPPDSCPPPDAIANDTSSLMAKILGCTISECPGRAKAMSPTTYINGNEPPFCLYHGTFDCVTPPIQSQILYDKLIAKGDNVTLNFIPHAAHEDDYFYTPIFKDSVRSFFDRALLKNPIPCVNNFQNSIKPDFNTEVFPNPFVSISDLIIYAARPLTTYLTVYNTGGEIMQHNSITLNEGRHSYTIGSKLKPGIYYIMVNNGNNVKVHKVLKTR